MSPALRGALTRYRVMAYVVGVTLLVFCVSMILKYVFHVGSDTVVAIAHGWLFVVYAAFAVDLSVRMRWPLWRMGFVVVAGMVPFLSFVAERRVVGWVHEELGQLQPAEPA